MTLFKNPKLQNLFAEFSDCDELEIGDSIGEMTHEDACKHRIPTKEELHYLIACGGLKLGDKDCWSSSVVSIFRDGAWVFIGYGGVVSSYGRGSPYGVRCVGRPCAAPAGPTASESAMDRVVKLLERIVDNTDRR
jgi:hypothetical protein